MMDPWDERFILPIHEWLEFVTVNVGKNTSPMDAIGFLGGGFKYFLFSPLFGEDFEFD